MDKTLGIFLVIYALVLWVILFLVWRKGYREWKATRAERLRQFPARVMDTRDGKLILFEYAGRQRELEVNPTTYEGIRIGMEGVLVLKGDRFQAFEPKSDMQRADEAYRRIVKD